MNEIPPGFHVDIFLVDRRDDCIITNNEKGFSLSVKIFSDQFANCINTFFR